MPEEYDDDRFPPARTQQSTSEFSRPTIINVLRDLVILNPSTCFAPRTPPSPASRSIGILVVEKDDLHEEIGD